MRNEVSELHKKRKSKCIFVKKIHFYTFNNSGFPLSPTTLQQEGLLWVKLDSALNTHLVF